MAAIAEKLYDWIRTANEARERLDLLARTIEEAIATLESAFGDAYLDGLMPPDEESGKQPGFCPDRRPTG
jgi:hypothetical protein